MHDREKSNFILPPMFPSSRRRYVRVPPEYVHEYLIHLLKENLQLKNEGIKQDDFSLGVNLGGKLGASLSIHITSEGDVSILNLSFKYGKITVLAVSLFSAAVILSVLFSSAVPMLGIAILLLLAYRVNLEVIRFLDFLNENLPFLEKEYHRQVLMKNRERWRKHLKYAREFYEKLRKRHIEIWGNTNVLDYKIKDYQSRGLTYEEAIIKIAEEEGVISDQHRD